MAPWITEIIYFCHKLAFQWHINLTITTRFSYKQLSYQESNGKNGLKNKQLAKQPPTLKTPMQNFWLDSG